MVCLSLMMFNQSKVCLGTVSPGFIHYNTRKNGGMGERNMQNVVPGKTALVHMDLMKVLCIVSGVAPMCVTL